MPALTLVDLAGAQRRAVQSVDNSRCIADLRFDAAPAETLIAGAAARDAALHILALQAVVTAHEQTGGAEALIERSVSVSLSSAVTFIARRSEEHTSDLQSLMRISYAVFCLKKKRTQIAHEHTTTNATN